MSWFVNLEAKPSQGDGVCWVKRLEPEPRTPQGPSVTGHRWGRPFAVLGCRLGALRWHLLPAGREGTVATWAARWRHLMEKSRLAERGRDGATRRAPCRPEPVAPAVPGR